MLKNGEQAQRDENGPFFHVASNPGTCNYISFGTGFNGFTFVSVQPNWPNSSTTTAVPLRSDIPRSPGLQLTAATAAIFPGPPTGVATTVESLRYGSAKQLSAAAHHDVLSSTSTSITNTASASSSTAAAAAATTCRAGTCRPAETDDDSNASNSASDDDAATRDGKYSQPNDGCSEHAANDVHAVGGDGADVDAAGGSEDETTCHRHRRPSYQLPGENHFFSLSALVRQMVTRRALFPQSIHFL